MLVALVFAGLVLLCGQAVTRALRAPVSLAPFAGLASISVLTTWCAAVGAPPLAGTGLVVGLAAFGSVTAGRAAGRAWIAARSAWLTTAIVAASVAIPWLLLGAALANLDAPVSTHD